MKAACPTCTGPTRETVGMVCQTCGTDYAVTAADRAALAEALPPHQSWCHAEAHGDCCAGECDCGVADSLEALLPVVQRLCDQRAAEALEDAARWLTGTGNASEGLAPDRASDGLSWRLDVRTPTEASDWFEQSLRDRAAALRARADQAQP